MFMNNLTLQFLKDNLNHYEDPALKRIYCLHAKGESIGKTGRKQNRYTLESIALKLDICIERIRQLLAKSAIKSAHNFCILLAALNNEEVDLCDLEELLGELKQNDKFVIKTQEIIINQLTERLKANKGES